MKGILPTNLVTDLLTEASDGLDDSPESNALLAHRALHISEGRRTAYRSVQALIVARVAEDQSWSLHPQGFSSIREFIADAGITGSALSYLTFIGEELVPYCLRSGIDYEQYLTHNITYLMDVIPTIRERIEGDDDIKDVLDDIGKAPSRESIRDKYVRSGDKPYRAAVVSGRYIIIDAGDDIDRASKFIGGKAEWSLVVTKQLTPREIKIVIRQ